MKTRSLVKTCCWFIVLLIVVLMIEFPRGNQNPSVLSQVTSSIHMFTWASYGRNLDNLFHRIVTLSPGMTLDGRSIVGIVLPEWLSTLALMAVAFLFTLIIGISKGIYDGFHAHRKSFGTSASGILQWLGESLPDFFLITGILSVCLWLHLNIPVIYNSVITQALVLCVVPAMFLARMVKQGVRDQLAQLYVVTARAKGLKRTAILFRHLMPNFLGSVYVSLLPIFGLLFSGLVVVEYLFFRSGLMSGFFYAMGNSGAGSPIYGAPFAPQNVQGYGMYPTSSLQSQYYQFDPALCLADLLGCFTIFVVIWIVMRVFLHFFGYRNVANPYSTGIENVTIKHRTDWRMLLGLGMIVGLIVVSLCSNYLPIPKPNVEQSAIFTSQNIVPAPFPPSSAHWLGTDVFGRDLFSRALHFTIPTLLLVGVSVILIGLLASCLAILSSVYQFRFVRWLIFVWNSLTTLIPGAVGALLIIQIPNLYWIGVQAGDGFAFWTSVHRYIVLLVLILLETGKVAYILQDTIDSTWQKEYMESAMVAGNSRTTAFLVHMLFPFRQSIFEQLMIEFSRVLMLIAVIGYFQVTLGQSWSYAKSGWIFTPIGNDWGTLFAENAGNYFDFPWVLFAPALFVTWTVMGMSLILNGYRRIAHVTSWKGSVSLLSPSVRLSCYIAQEMSARSSMRRAARKRIAQLEFTSQENL